MLPDDYDKPYPLSAFPGHKYAKLREWKEKGLKTGGVRPEKTTKRLIDEFQLTAQAAPVVASAPVVVEPKRRGGAQPKHRYAA